MTAEYDRRFREPLQPGDLVAWQARVGTVVVKLLSRRHGEVSILSADGHSEHWPHDLPSKARPATADERRDWERRARPMAPPYSND